ncbi:hypothetical protein BLSTO_05510 [Blastocystis sp. subtype 1]
MDNSSDYYYPRKHRDRDDRRDDRRDRRDDRRDDRHDDRRDRRDSRHDRRRAYNDVRTNNVSEEVDLAKLERGEDKRSVVMIRNLPNRCTVEGFLRVMDMIVPGRYKILNMPIDSRTHRNLGYSFIQFNSVEDLITAYKSLQGKRWPHSESVKTISFCYAKIQADNDGGVARYNRRY